MTANPHLVPQLDAYRGQNEPGFAILIDAPWGAGKTHAIKAWLHGKDHCQISLFGVASIEGIEEALFNRLLDGRDTNLPNGLTKLAEGLAQKFAGVTIDITGFHRQQVLKDLPKLLVFDDLERARMEPPALLAALNRFVEHEARHVILIANEAELDKTGDYRRWREKVVGRTITLKPETDSALDTCLASLCVGDQKDFLADHRDLIITVFQGSQTGNLRLLRQSVTEFVALHAALPDDIRSKTSGMRYLLASYLALSVAYHAGQITKGDLLQPRQSSPKPNREPNGEQPPPTPLQSLRDRFKDDNLVILSGDALPRELARQLIGDGYAPADFIAIALRDLAIFRNEDDEPWVTLWDWRRRDEADVTAALDQVRAQLDRKEITDPTIILHLWGVFFGFAKHGIGALTEETASQQITNYIAVCETEGVLPVTYPKAIWNNDFLQESSHGLGYAYLETPEFQAIRDHLISALDRVYRAGDAKRLADLLTLLQSDVEGFVLAISGRGARKDIPDYSREPIFSAADPAEVARVLLSLPPEQMLAALRPFKDRMIQLRANATTSTDQETAGNAEHPEHIFLRRLRDEAIHVADAATPIRAAQIRNALHWHFGFLDPPSPDVSPANP